MTVTITIRESATGKLAMINGKSYTLLRLYEDRRLDGIFCLAVAGRVPLKPTDLDEHWCVFRGGDVYIALDARPFSYHLILGETASTDAPNWPRFKAPAPYYAFVGPTEEALRAQIRLTLERYRSRLKLEDALLQAITVDDLCGGPPAYLLSARKL